MRRIVACCGTFDGTIHPGHINFLEEAKRYGEELVVFINTDTVVKRNKNRQPLYVQSERQAHIQALNIAERVVTFEGTDKLQLQQLAKLRPAVWCFSQKNDYPFDRRIQQSLAPLGTTFIWIPVFGNYSTTKLHFS